MQAVNIILDTIPQLQNPAPQKTMACAEQNGNSFLDRVKSELSKDHSTEDAKGVTPAAGQEKKTQTVQESGHERESGQEKKELVKQTETGSTDSEKNATVDRGRVSGTDKPEKIPVPQEKSADTVLKKGKSSDPAGKNKTDKKQVRGTDVPVESAADTAKLTAEQISWLNGQSVRSVTPAQTPGSDKKNPAADIVTVKENSGEQQQDKKTAAVTLNDAQNLSVTDPGALLRDLAAGKTQGKLSDAEDKSGEKEHGSKKISKPADTVLFDVTDLRTEAGSPQEKIKTAVKSDFVTSVKYDGQNNVQMTLNLTNQVQQNILSSSDQAASATGSNFQTMLANQLQHNAADFVRAGSIVLRDNNVGNINLVLHPESLGNVKISLQLTDKVIAGHITVASQEAYNAFHESIGSLRQAFAQNGFDSPTFDLSWTGQQNSSAGSGNRGQDQPGTQYRSSQVYGDFAASDGATAVSGAVPAAGTAGDYRVNIVA